MRKDILRLRRGVGLIYIIAGVLHAGEMVFVSLNSLHILHLSFPAGFWLPFFFAPFLFLILGSMSYLGLGFSECGIFYYEVLADFLVGIAGFFVLFSVIAFTLRDHPVSPWFSLLPSVFVLAFGVGLRQGRTCGFGPKLQPLP